jgi:ankyrin repeat protein
MTATDIFKQDDKDILANDDEDSNYEDDIFSHSFDTDLIPAARFYKDTVEFAQDLIPAAGLYKPVILNAILRGVSFDMLDLLLANGAEINETDEIGDTALHIATYYRYTYLQKYLISKGADPYIENKDGYSPNNYYHKIIMEDLNYDPWAGCYW